MKMMTCWWLYYHSKHTLIMTSKSRANCPKSDKWLLQKCSDKTILFSWLYLWYFEIIKHLNLNLKLLTRSLPRPDGTQSILMLYNDLVISALWSRVGVINICSKNDPFHKTHDIILASRMAFSEMVDPDHDHEWPLAIRFTKFITL